LPDAKLKNVKFVVSFEVISDSDEVAILNEYESFSKYGICDT
jgi:hypothetical protein